MPKSGFKKTLSLSSLFNHLHKGRGVVAGECGGGSMGPPKDLIGFLVACSYFTLKADSKSNPAFLVYPILDTKISVDPFFLCPP